jgi:hypothetical protein
MAAGAYMELPKLDVNVLSPRIVAFTHQPGGYGQANGIWFSFIAATLTLSVANLCAVN